jgi:hypothetical protein
VMAAIAEAAPFPAPPGWVAKYLRLSYGGRRAPVQRHSSAND